MGISGVQWKLSGGGVGFAFLVIWEVEPPWSSGIDIGTCTMQYQYWDLGKENLLNQGRAKT